ncbi:MAG: hypothetical protein R3F11_29805 [Verrucomicrobiales bacterium]
MFDSPGVADNLTSVVVSATIGGDAFSAGITEGVFTGTGGVFSTVATDVTSVGSAFDIEDPALQDGAVSLGWGVDSDGTSPSHNAAILINLGISPTPIFNLSMTLADVESSAAGEFAYAVVYDLAGTLVDSTPLVFPTGEDGASESHFFGYASDPGQPIGYLAIIVGDSDIGGNGHTERIAFGDFAVGASPLAVPPHRYPVRRARLIVAGLAGIGLRRRRRARALPDRDRPPHGVEAPPRALLATIGGRGDRAREAPHRAGSPAGRCRSSPGSGRASA